MTRMGAVAVSGVVAAVTAAFAGFAPSGPARVWGEAGHRMAAELAVDLLPRDMPPFFRNARAQLAYLNPEPDRWRDGAERQRDAALDQRYYADHFINLELIPAARQDAVFRAPSRFAYGDSLRTLGLSATRVGMSPFAMLELAQRLRSGFSRWRRESNPEVRRWIEQRIIDDAGILGHYVTDAANPAHTTIHFDGWVGANPRGFTTASGFHGRFETAFVQRRVRADDIRAFAATAARELPDFRAAIIAHVRESHGHVVRMYELDQVRPFGAGNDAPEHRQFAAQRLAAGAVMLRDLWWTAWVTSARD